MNVQHEVNDKGVLCNSCFHLEQTACGVSSPSDQTDKTPTGKVKPTKQR